MRAPKGFLSLNLLIAMATGTALTAAAFTFSIRKTRVEDGLQEAIIQARNIALTADIWQRQVQSTVPGTVYTYTWQNQAAFVGVGSLNTATGRTLPVNTTFGTPFEWMAQNGVVAEARFLVPTVEGVIGVGEYAGVSMTAVAGGTRVSVFANPQSSTLLKRVSMLNVKRSLYQETVR